MSVALIAGASGLVGGRLLNLLLDTEDYTKIVSIGRRKLKIIHPRLEQYISDFEKLDELDIKPDVVFCCLGTTIKKAGSKEAFKKVDFEYPKLLANYSLIKGANAFHIITAMGANSNSSIFYNKVKGEIEDELKSLAFRQMHIYQPSLLLGERQEKRLAEGISQSITKGLGFLFVGPLKNYKAIAGEKVAKSMYDKSIEHTEGVFVHLSGEMQ